MVLPCVVWFYLPAAIVLQFTAVTPEMDQGKMRLWVGQEPCPPTLQLTLITVVLGTKKPPNLNYLYRHGLLYQTPYNYNCILPVEVPQRLSTLTNFSIHLVYYMKFLAGPLWNLLSYRLMPSLPFQMIRLQVEPQSTVAEQASNISESM